jgi:hypothetical protein
VGRQRVLRTNDFSSGQTIFRFLGNASSGHTHHTLFRVHSGGPQDTHCRTRPQDSGTTRLPTITQDFASTRPQDTPPRRPQDCPRLCPPAYSSSGHSLTNSQVRNCPQDQYCPTTQHNSQVVLRTAAFAVFFRIRAAVVLRTPTVKKMWLSSGHYPTRK